MILKELDPFHGTDKFQIAGRRAEEQMAFYLRRYFKAANDVFVINGLKIWLDGETAQIDHLVVHPTGLIIVESKSVAGKISITRDLQWIRQYGEKQVGMKSPIIQAKMQGQLLSELISIFAKPAQFLSENIVTLVAISDNGIIEWPDSGPLEGVKKADQICDEIIRIAAETFVPENALVSYDEMLARITPETYGYDNVVTRGWWALVCAGFLSDCDTICAEIKNAQTYADQVEFAAHFYALAWRKNEKSALGVVHTTISDNLTRRIARIRSEMSPVTHKVHVTKNRPQT